MTTHDWAGLSTYERYQAAVGGSRSRDALKRRQGNMSGFRRRIIVTDIFMITLCLSVGLLVSSRASSWSVDPILAVYSVPPAIGVVWFAALAARGAYDQNFLGLGTEEVRRVVSGILLTFAVVAGVSYLLRADISRAYAFVSLPLGVVAIICGRFFWRGWLYRARSSGQFMARTLIVGDGPAADELSAVLAESRYAGFEVTARFSAPFPDDSHAEAWLDELDSVISQENIDAVAVTPTASMSSKLVNEIGWRLEGHQIDLLIAPALLDLAGPRLSMRPIAGLPIMHLDEVVLTRSQRIAKRTLDITLSAALLVLLCPVMVACAVAVRVSSPGPVIFRQQRVGRAGRPFTVLKFRTMVEGADDDRARLRTFVQDDGATFKMPHDPRITGIGRHLRRWSLDELPQLFNVLTGSMSLVGPRPHPLDDVDRYEVEAYRRLALKPGLTGLWQVEGRSSLTWAEALQLDIYYVERWTLAGDIVLLARTLRAVVQGRGAF